MKTYDSKKVAYMQAGSKTKKTGITHLTVQDVTGWVVGTFDEITALIKSRESDKTQTVKVVVGDFIKETKCFIGLTVDGVDVWFKKDRLVEFTVSDAGRVEVSLPDEMAHAGKTYKGA